MQTAHRTVPGPGWNPQPSCCEVAMLHHWSKYHMINMPIETDFKTKKCLHKLTFHLLWLTRFLRKNAQMID